jgi:catechol 2,3-dioxygenase-like lactoylglutathione lyase family enzyme
MVRGNFLTEFFMGKIVHRFSDDSAVTQMEVGATIAFRGVTPILRVQSLEASINYYVRLLGFKLNWQAPGFASVSRGRCGIFLSQGNQGHDGGWVWVGVSDADVLLDKYRRTATKVRRVPTKYPWAYEVQLEDPDGNVLRCGSDPKKDGRLGKWLDMRGDRWIMSSETCGGGSSPTENKSRARNWR